jgi:hypothetical protein
VFFEITPLMKAHAGKRLDRQLEPLFNEIEESVLGGCHCPCSGKSPSHEPVIGTMEIACHVTFLENSRPNKVIGRVKSTVPFLMSQIERARQARFRKITRMEVLPADIPYPKSKARFGYVLWFKMARI